MSDQKSDSGHSVLHTELIIKTEGNEIETDNITESSVFDHQTSIKSENQIENKSEKQPIDFQIAAVKNEVFVEEKNFNIDENGENLNTDPLELLKWKCDLCDKSFSESGYLKKHINTIHKGQKVHKCESCNKSFSYAHHLKTHIHTIHKDHKDHKCESCGKSFSQAGALKKHIHTVHESRKD